MQAERASILNRLIRELPEGYVVDTKWLGSVGLSSSSVRNYIQRGWLERVGPRLYRRPGLADTPASRWEYAILSLQGFLDEPVHVGGLTALELAGYWHYAPMGRRTVWLFSDARSVRSFMSRLDLDADMVIRSRKLFGDNEMGVEARALDLATSSLSPLDAGSLPGARHKQHLRVSSPERAILELIDEVPDDISFDHAAQLFDGLTTLRPRLVGALLSACQSVKAKRLFLYFAGRQDAAWARKLDPADFDLGKGKRQIVVGGELDPVFGITVPRGLRTGEKEQANDG